MLKKVLSRILSITTATTVTIVILSAQTQAAVIAFNESLLSPDASSVYRIGVPNLFGDGSPVGLRLRTLSYGGGTTWESPVTPGGNPISRNVSSGGFDPILTLSNSIGNNVAQVDDSSILGNQADRNTGRVYDSAFDLRVAPGNYGLTVTQYDNFGGGLRRISGFTDVTGSERTNQFTVQAHTISDYLSNSVSVDLTGITNGVIKATLEPKTTNLFNNLSDLAAFGGFNHFNWFNIVQAKNLLARLELFGPDEGGFDPIRGGNNPSNPSQRNDEFQWYWDEAPSDSRYIWSKYYRDNPARALWGDSPGLAIPFASITFETYLAGVRSGDDGTIFANIDGNSFENLSFKWRYTQGFNGGSINNLFADLDSLQDNGGSIEFLGFLQPEDWTQERIAQLQSLGLNIAGLEGGSLTTSSPVAVPEPFTIIGTIIGGTAVCRMRKKLKATSDH